AGDRARGRLFFGGRLRLLRDSDVVRVRLRELRGGRLVASLVRVCGPRRRSRAWSERDSPRRRGGRDRVWPPAPARRASPVGADAPFRRVPGSRGDRGLTGG